MEEKKLIEELSEAIQKSGEHEETHRHIHQSHTRYYGFLRSNRWTRTLWLHH